MKATEMNTIQKTIYKAIKAHYEETINDFLTNEKPIEFISMEISEKRKTVKCYDGKTLTHYEVITRHSVKDKYDDNLTIWDVCLYSDGSIGVYYDGSGWLYKKSDGTTEIQKHY